MSGRLKNLFFLLNTCLATALRSKTLIVYGWGIAVLLDQIVLF